MPVTWFALAALLILPTPQDARPNTPSVDKLDAVCRSAYQALASGRLEPLAASYPSAEEMQAYNTWRLRNESAEERQRIEELVRKRGGMEQVRKDELRELGARLEQARAKVARHFAWKNAHYVGALPPRRSTPEAANDPFETAEVEFLVSADGELWSFGAKFALRSPSGWSFRELSSLFRERPWLRSESRGTELAELQDKLDAASLEAMKQSAAAEMQRDELARCRAELEQCRAELEARAASFAAEARAMRERMDEYLVALQRSQQETSESLDQVRSRDLEIEALRDAIDRERMRTNDSSDEREFAVAQLSQELRRTQLERDAWIVHLRGIYEARDRREAVRNEPGVDQDQAAPAAPAWIAPSPKEKSRRVELRERLAVQIDASHGAIPRSWILNFVRQAAGVEIALLRDAFADGEDAELPFEAEGLPISALLEQAVQPLQILEREGVLYVGTAAELAGLDQAFFEKPGTGGAEAKLYQKLADTRMSIEQSVTLGDLLDVLPYYAEFDGYRRQSDELDVDLESPAVIQGPATVPCASVLALAAHYYSVRGQVVEGLVCFDSKSSKPIELPKLDPALLRGIEVATPQVFLGPSYLEGRIEELAELFEVQLELAEELREPLEDVYFGRLFHQRCSLELVLRLCAMEALRIAPVEWVRKEQKLVLSPKKK